MSSAVVPTLEPVLAAEARRPGSIDVYADDSDPLIDSVEQLDAVVVHVENNGSDGSAVHQNSLVCQVKSDAGPVVVAGLEPTGSFDRGDPAVGPSNQTASGAGICLANYCAEIVNPDRNNEYRSSIGELERCRWGKE